MAKAWPVEGIGPDVALGECARRIVDTRFREVLNYMPGTIDGRDIEQLHSMRVSTRRLRSALKNFAPCFERSPLRKHEARIRELAAVLGEVRDLDVKLAWLAAERERAPEPERAGIDLLVGAATRARDRARGPMVAYLERLERENYERKFLDWVWEDARRG